jgi:hypothetical protein
MDSRTVKHQAFEDIAILVTASPTHISIFTLRYGHFTDKRFDIPSCSSTMAALKALGRRIPLLIRAGYFSYHR